MKPMIRIHNLETNEIIDREMTDSEFAAYQLEQEQEAKFNAETQAKTDAKAALLERLGITAEEAQLLFN